jgi:hypothetical protein
LGWDSKWETRVKLYFNRISKYHYRINIIDRKSFWRDGSILFTVAAYFLPKLPTSSIKRWHCLIIYMISTSGTDIENQERWLMVQHFIDHYCVNIQLIGNALRKYYGKVK